MSKLELDSKQVKKQKRNIKKCRGAQNHYSIHSPKHDVEFCKKCDAHVEVISVTNNGETENDICRCCGSKTIKIQKKTWLARVLKAGIRQHRNIIRDWIMFPEGALEEPIKPRTVRDLNGNKIRVTEGYTKKPKHSQQVEIKFNSTVYSIEIKYLALYLETINEEEKLNIIGKKIGIKGYRITYPESEEMDEKCVTCSTKLKYNLDQQIFCPNCNGNV